MAVLDAATLSVSSNAIHASGALTGGLVAVTERLEAAGQLLATTATDEAVSEAVVELKTVEADLLELACCSSTEVHAAGLLVRVRDDLSGHLLAAAVVSEAGGKAPEAGYDILRRAVASTVDGIGVLL